MASVTGALSALWSTAVFLYNVIDQVQSNDAECRETIGLLCEFLTALEELRGRNVSLALEGYVAKLVKTFEDIKVDIALLEMRSLLSRAAFHEQIASKLAKARSSVNEAMMRLTLQLQLERYRAAAECPTFPIAAPYGSSLPHPEYRDGPLHDGPSHGTSRIPAATCYVTSNDLQYNVHRTIDTQNRARSNRSCFKKPVRVDDVPASKVPTKGTDTKQDHARLRRPRSRPCSMIAAATSSSRGNISSSTPNRSVPRGADCEATRHRGEGCEWQEPCAELLGFTNAELSRSLSLPHNDDGVDALRKHLKLLASNDPVIDQSLLGAWYAVDRRRRKPRNA